MYVSFKFSSLRLSYFNFSYPVALALVASRKAAVKQLITHNYNLEETVAAFETAKTPDALKVMIHCQKK